MSYWCSICQKEFEGEPASSVFIEGDEYYCCKECLKKIRGEKT